MKNKILITGIFSLALFLGSCGVMFAEETSVEVVPAAEQTNTSSETQTTTGTSVVDSTEQSSIDLSSDVFLHKEFKPNDVA